MTEREQISRYVSMAFFKFQSGTLTEEELAQFEALLAQDKTAREHYYDIAYVSTLLKSSEGILGLEDLIEPGVEFWEELAESERQGPKVERAAEAPLETPHKVIRPAMEKRKMSRFQKLTLSACAAIILLLVSLNFLTEKTYSVPVATVADQIDARWLGTGFKNGERLRTNKDLLRLDRGLVSIKFDDGIDAVVEGPARFAVERSGVYVEYGRLYCRVSDRGLGFSVETPTARYVDQGTEFGLQAEIDGSSELHVTKGKVQMFAGAKGDAKTSLLVTQNHAVHYSAGNEETASIPIEREAFARRIDSATGAVVRGGEQAQYDSYVKSLGAAAYFRVKGTRTRSFRDVMQNQAVEIDLKDTPLAAGFLLRDGEQAGALRIEGAEPSMRIGNLSTVAQNEHGYYTIGLWLRFDSIDEQVIFRDITNDAAGIFRVMSMDKDGRIAHGANSASPEGQRIAASANSLEQGKWYFIAVTRSVEPENEKTLYINGEEAAREVRGKAGDFINRYRTIEIGGRSGTADGMSGELGGIMLFPRALSAEEIARLSEFVPAGQN